MNTIRFSPILSPKQGKGLKVHCFTATAKQIESVARIDRIGRDDTGTLSGFQRPQIASHIREIEDFLRLPDAMLPNAIVLAFQSNARVSKGELIVNIKKGPPGWVVDGQQRLSAALRVENRPIELVVSAFICSDLAELNRQFILINNTRPLPKQLVYELLPGVTSLPKRLSDRARVAMLVEALNYREDSSLRGQIQQQTNPEGIIKDTLMHRALTNSISNGALREFSGDELLDAGFQLVSDYFEAVQDVFASDWNEHTPKTSRLVHGVGIVAMSYVMDEIAHKGPKNRGAFAKALKKLKPEVHWTSGDWNFGDEIRPWNTLQNVSSDYWLLSNHLVRLVRRSAPSRKAG